MRAKTILFLLIPFVGFIVLFYTYPNFQRSRKPLSNFFHWSLLPDGAYRATCVDQIDMVPRPIYDVWFIFDPSNNRFGTRHLILAAVNRTQNMIVNEEGTFTMDAPINDCRFSTKLNFRQWNFAWQQLERQINHNSTLMTFVGTNVFGQQERMVVHLTELLPTFIWTIRMEWKASNISYTHTCMGGKQPRADIDVDTFFKLPHNCVGFENSRAWFDFLP